MYGISNIGYMHGVIYSEYIPMSNIPVEDELKEVSKAADNNLRHASS